MLGDLTLSVFPIGWIFGRMGCAVVHDHPGRLAAEGAWLAVAFPEGPRYDLGLLEMFLSVGISLVCVALWRVRPRVGTYIAVTTLIYAPVRFYMDFFRIDDPVAGDPRYGGLTPAQWACVAVFVYGIAVAVRVARSPKAPPVTALPTPTAT